MKLREDLWVTEVSTSFPDATFRLLTGVPKDDRAIELGEILAEDPDSAAAAVRDHPAIVAYDRLLDDEQRAIIQYEANDRSLYEFLWEFALPPEFPIDVENGAMEFDMTATRAQFEAFGERLDTEDAEYELLTVVHTDDEASLLTERQRECLTVAQRRGYFDVPRECTLDEVADALEVDKSSASKTIRRGMGRVLDQFLVGGE